MMSIADNEKATNIFNLNYSNCIMAVNKKKIATRKYLKNMSSFSYTTVL